ncbi:hypothetical protein TNCV_306611 [Trichonephila clavipes]|nr:hypothetical protein TNCV_306611 [Trichonephila clavipes]
MPNAWLEILSNSMYQERTRFQISCDICLTFSCLLSPIARLRNDDWRLLLQFRYTSCLISDMQRQLPLFYETPTCHGSRVVQVSDRSLPCYEFDPSITKDPPCRAAMRVKSVES